MKKSSLFFTVVFLLVLSFHTKAQTLNSSDYFLGKWSVIVEGTPNGDAKMFVRLEKKDTTLTGSILDSTNKEITKISRIELKDSSVTVYFTAQGYDVYLVMEKKDDDHVKGNMLDMFTANGERVKEEEEESN